MQQKNSSLDLFSLEQAIDRHPLTVAPDTLLVDAIALMSQARGGSCSLPDPDLETRVIASFLNGTSTVQALSSCVLVTDGSRAIGIFTERDLVRQAAAGKKLEGVTVGEVMTRPAIALKVSELHNVLNVLKLFREHHIRHLPIIDDRGQPIGLVTPESLRRVLQPPNLLRWRQVREVMSDRVIQASKMSSVLNLAQLMATHQVSCVVITEEREIGEGGAFPKNRQPFTHNPEALTIPVGIVTERDLVQFQTLQLDLTQLQAQTVMSAPLFCVSSEDSLWNVHLQMQQQRVRRAVVTGRRGELLGLVTQSSLLQVFDPIEMYEVLEVLQCQVSELEAEKVQLLQKRNEQLEEQVRERTANVQAQAERERLLAQVAARIRQSLKLEDILNSTVTEVRQFLACDRVLVYQFDPNMDGTIVAESVGAGWTVSLGNQVQDTYFQKTRGLEYLHGRTQVTDDIYQAGLTPCHLNLLEHYEVKAIVVVPIVMDRDAAVNLPVSLSPGSASSPYLWGLLVAHQCSDVRQWKNTELELLDRLAVQIAIAIQQAELFAQVQTELAARKRAEDLYAKSEKILTLFYESAPIGLCITDENGRFVRLNPAFCRFFGYRAEDLLGQPQSTVLSLDTDGEWQIRRDDGKVFDIYMTTGLAIAEDGKRYKVTTLTDITERKQAERAIQESAQRLLIAIETVGEGITVSDAEGRFGIFNSKMAEITGYTSSEANRCENFLAVIHPEVEEYERAIARLQQLRENREFRNIETTIRAKDGTRKTLLVSTSLIEHEGHDLFLSAYRDISNRKRSEEALRQSERRYRQIVETAMEGIWVIDRNEGTSFVNQRMASMLGYTVDEMIGKPLLAFMDNEVQQSAALHLERRRQGIGEQHDFKFKRKDGSDVWTLLSANALFDEAGNYAGALAMITDITERKQAEAALQQLNAELEARVQQRTAELASTVDRLQQEIEQRQRSEQALRKSEEQYRTLVENYPDGAAILFDRDLRYTIADGAGLTEWGLSKELLEGKTIWEIFSPEICAILEPDSRSALAGLAVTREMMFGDRLYLVKTLPVKNNRGEIFAGMVLTQDITERKQAEEALRQSEERFVLAMEGVKDGIWDWNIQTDCTYFSPRWKSMLGYKNSEIPNIHNAWEQLLHPADRERVFTILNDYLAGKIPIYEVEFRARHKDGSYRWILARGTALWDKNGKPYRMAGSHTDITDRKRSEVEMQRQLAAIEAATDGIAVLNLAGEFIYLNQAYVQFFGFSCPAELLSKTWRELYSPDEINRFERDIFPILMRDGQWQGEATATRQDGSTFAQEVSFTRLGDGGLICVCRDISEMLRTLRELQQTEEKLKASLSEKELLLKEVHHRVKNNMQVICSLFSLQSQSIDDPQILSILEDSQNRIGSMALIHEKLYQSDSLAKINFCDYIQNLASNLFSSYNISSNQISLELRVENVSLNLDTAIPCGLLINELISNSLKHAFPKKQSGELRIDFSVNSEARLSLTVQDNGIGLPDDLDVQRANSLGLRLVRALTRQLKGTLDMDGSNGTRFQITFPQPKEHKRF